MLLVQPINFFIFFHNKERMKIDTIYFCSVYVVMMTKIISRK